MGACHSIHYVDDDDDFDWSSFFVNDHYSLKDGERMFYRDLLFVEHLVKQDGLNLRCVDPTHLDNPNVVALALKQNGLAIQYVPLDKRTKETVLLAVQQNGNALMFAPPECQDDCEVVSAAVAQDSRAIKWASERLKGDKGLVLDAVTKNGFALSFVSRELRADEDVISAAVDNQKKAEIYAIKKPTNGGYVQPFVNDQPLDVA